MVAIVRMLARAAGVAVKNPRVRLFCLFVALFAVLWIAGNQRVRLGLASGLPGVLFGAVTVTQTAGFNVSAGVQDQDFQEWSVIMSANTDTTTGSVTHLMGALCKRIILTPLTAVGVTAGFFQSTLSSTAWAATVGGTEAGAAPAQLGVRVERHK